MTDSNYFAMINSISYRAFIPSEYLYPLPHKVLYDIYSKNDPFQMQQILNDYITQYEQQYPIDKFVSPFRTYTVEDLQIMLKERDPTVSTTMIGKVCVDSAWLSYLGPPPPIDEGLPKVDLMPHQKLVADYMTLDETKGLLLVHQTGSGKTLTAIHTCVEMMKKWPDKTCVIVCPVSVRPHFQKEIRKYGVERAASRFSISSFKSNEVLKTDESINKRYYDKILVIDEVHNLRNRKTIRSQIMVKACYTAFKVLLLSATPVVNKLEDLEVPMMMIFGNIRGNMYKEKFINNFADVFDTDLSRYTFSYYERTANDPNYPKVVEQKISVPLEDQYADAYQHYHMRIMKDLLLTYGNINLLVGMKEDSQRFMIHANDMRRAGNAGYLFETPKVTWTLNKLVESRKKTVIYSFWVGCGVDMLSYALTLLSENPDIPNREFFKHSLITGSVSESNRASIIDSFNRDEFSILLISSAGGEGIDLFGVRQVIILEMGWNDSGIKQAVNRAVRYKSHEHLPPDERLVEVYFLLLNSTQFSPTFDELLYSNYVLKKREIAENVMNLIKKVSIENNIP